MVVTSSDFAYVNHGERGRKEARLGLWETPEAYLMGFKQINMLLIYPEVDKGHLSSFLVEELKICQLREHRCKGFSHVVGDGVKGAGNTGNRRCVWGKNVIDSNPRRWDLV